MSNFTDFFPSAGGGGGGGGILKQHVITSSGTVDLTTLGIADGDLIQLFLVAGGQSGGRDKGGYGGNIWSGSVTVGTAGTATVTIGAGGAGGSSSQVAGGVTSITGGGIPTTNTSNPGLIPGGRGAVESGAALYDDFPTNAGFSQGGGSDLNSNGRANTGEGGGGDANSSSSSKSGGSGIAIIYYS